MNHQLKIVFDKKWFALYKRLQAYHETHGNTLVPQKYNPDRALGRWVNKQRALQKMGELRADRKALLDDLGFVWNTPKIVGLTNDSQWQVQYDKLIAYKQQHGDTLVPSTYIGDTSKDKNEKSLGSWANHQRRAHRSGKLRQDRKELLEKIDFCWEPMTQTSTDDAKWEEHYQRLVAYRAKNGDTTVPSYYPADMSLGVWVSNQRLYRQRDRLRPERLERLNQIDFVWVVPKATNTAVSKKDDNEQDGEGNRISQK